MHGIYLYIPSLNKFIIATEKSIKTLIKDNSGFKMFQDAIESPDFLTKHLRYEGEDDL